MKNKITLGAVFALLVLAVVVAAIATGGIRDIWWMVAIFAVLIGGGFIWQHLTTRNK